MRIMKGVINEDQTPMEEPGPVRTAISDGRMVRIQQRTLNADLTCPVCLGILRDTMTVMNCLHRFCAECIELSLRMGRKECPSCRTSCPSRRNLRKDPQFDKLIAEIYPDVDKEETQQMEMTKKIIEQHNDTAFVKSIEKGQSEQAIARRSRISRPRPVAMDMMSSFNPNVPSSSSNSLERSSKRQKVAPREKLLDFGLFLHPECKEDDFLKQPLKVSFLRCPPTVTCSWLQVYLKEAFGKEFSFEITVRKDGKERVIVPDQNLQKLAEELMETGDTSLVLYYSPRAAEE